jgi:hypothetical protein
MFRKISIALVAVAALGSATLRPRHRPGDAAGGSAGSMADTMRDGAIAVSATGTAAPAGAISIRTAASDRGQ